MPLLTIHHKTEYRYKRPVAFGEHSIMLRPRDGHDLRVLDSHLEIRPKPMSLRWIHDVFGNSVAFAPFDERARTLSFDWQVTVEHNPVDEFALTIPTARSRNGRAPSSTRRRRRRPSRF